MLVKSVVLLFCCALINAKSLVQRDPRLEGRGEIEDAKLPDILKGFLRNVKIHDVDRLGGDYKLGANLQVEQEEEDEGDEDEDESSLGAHEEEKQAPENPNVAANQEKDEEDDEDSDEEVSVGNENNENIKDQNKSNDEEEDEEEEEEEDTEDEKTRNQKETKDKKDDEESEESDEEESDELDPEDAPKQETHAFRLSNALLGSEMKSPETFKLSKQSLNLPSPAAVKTPTADDELADKVANFFALESLLKGFLPSEDSSPKEPVSKPETDEESLIKEIGEMEKTNNNVAEEKIVTSNQAPRPAFDFDLDDTKQLGALISQAVPKNFDMIQAQFQGAKDFWKKTTFDDLQAKLQQGVQDFWQKTNFNDLLSKFQQGAKSLLQENTKEDTKESLHKDSKVGFGGFFNNKNNKLMFSNATTYVNKAVQRAQAKLDENGRIIYANNPPLTINVIPGTPITFKLKYVEGAHTLDTYGQSKAIHYGKVYAFTQYKFTELRYYYDVIISPYNLYNIRKSIAVILNDAPVKMNVAVDNDNKMNIMALEFVNPEIEVDSGSNRFVQYSLNYLINRYPVIKQKLVEIASRDSKLLLSDYLKDAQ